MVERWTAERIKEREMMEAIESWWCEWRLGLKTPTEVLKAIRQLLGEEG